MDRLKLDDFGGDFDDLLIDVDELQDQPNGPDGESLDKIAGVRDDARDQADDDSELEAETD